VVIDQLILFHKANKKVSSEKKMDKAVRTHTTLHFYSKKNIYSIPVSKTIYSIPQTSAIIFTLYLNSIPTTTFFIIYFHLSLIHTMCRACLLACLSLMQSHARVRCI
jgi:hypothetical protein